MKLLFAFLTLSSLLLLFVGSIDGRKELGEYWKKVIMKEQPMPDVIQDLVHHADALNYKDNNINAKSFASDDWNKLPFYWYHGAPETKAAKSFASDDWNELSVYGYHGATETEEEKPSSNAESRHCDDVEKSEQAKFAKD